MTPEKINQAIAEECGWKNCRNGVYFEGAIHYHPNHSTTYGLRNGIEAEIPNYFADLNACREMEGRLTHDECEKYHNELNTVQASGEETGCPAGNFWFHASAPQRCEAFLRAKGKWVE